MESQYVMPEGSMEHTPTAEEMAPEPVAPELPEWLPQKFAVVEDGKVNLEASAQKMAGSYSELEKQFSSGDRAPKLDAQTGAKQPSEQAIEAAQTPEGQTAVQAADAYYQEHGELSDEMYQRLNTAGLDRDMVDSYIRLRQQEATSKYEGVVATVGGEDAYKQMVEWAASNMTPQEIAAYDRLVESGDLSTLKFAVDGLATRYRAAVGWRPTGLASGQPTGGVNIQPYESQAEMMRDMQDPKYSTDPAFRNRVKEKLRNATF